MSYLRYLCLFVYSGVQHILFVGGRMSYLRYLCLFVCSGVQHILCCRRAHVLFTLFMFVGV